jgi:hypothetical protein
VPPRALSCDSRPRATPSDTGQTSTQGWSLANAATLARVRFSHASHDDGESSRGEACPPFVGRAPVC